MNTTTIQPVLEGARDFYASDLSQSGYAELKCVPAGGFAPKHTHFVARVNADHSMTVVDERLRDQLANWLNVEAICSATALAAEEGRFCFTNGNTMVYVEGEHLVTAFVQPVSVKREPLTSESAQRYLASNPAHRSLATASSLRAHAASKSILES